MARIRSAKPELLEDEKAAALPHDTWRMFVSSWLLADDYGNFRASPLLVHGAVFWAHPDADVAGMLRQLGDAGMLRFYTVNGQRYAHIANWSKHQKVDHPGAPLCPGPELADSRGDGGAGDGGGPQECGSSSIPSRETREALAKHSRLTGTGIRSGSGPGSGPGPIDRQAGPSASFEDFWTPYPRKVGKAAAKRAWDRLKPKPTAEALRSALAWQTVSEQWKRGIIPNPATYLNQKRWEDERPAAKPASAAPQGTGLELYCDWHRQALNEGKPSRRPKEACPSCKHLAARERVRPSSGPTAIGALADEMPGWGK